MHRILVIANAGAGSAQREVLEAALDVLRAGAEVEVVSTDETGDCVAALRATAGDSVVVAGGDGTLHGIVNDLYHEQLLRRVRLGLIPLGTGNDFARGVGLPLDPTAAAQVVAAGRTATLDLIVDDTDTVVVNNAHLGVGAQASKAAETWKPRLGRLGYAAGALAAGLRPTFLRVRVSVDDHDLVRRQRIVQVAVGNGSMVGGGTELIPGASPSSGQLVVMVSETRGTLTRLAYLLRLQGGTHHLMKMVERVSGRRVTVEGEPFHVSTDGELTGPVRRRTWTVMPGALEMYLPAS